MDTESIWQAIGRRLRPGAPLGELDVPEGWLLAALAAALLVVGHEKGYAGLNDRWIDLRVDDHPEPATELARLLELHRVYLDKPSTEPRRLSAEDIRWLQGVLHGQGRLEGTPTGAWDQETETALEGLFGVENLEERWVGGPAVDPVAWEHLTASFGDR